MNMLGWAAVIVPLLLLFGAATYAMVHDLGAGPTFLIWAASIIVTGSIVWGLFSLSGAV